MAKKKISKRTRPTKNVKKVSKKIGRTKSVKVPRRNRRVTVNIDTETVTVNVGPEKPRETIVSFLLDESGSMQSCLDSTIDGFNEYLNGRIKKDTGDSLFTFTKFDSAAITVVHDAVRLKNVTKLTRENYRPGASTPLYDAIGKTIRSLEATLKGRTEKPAVLFAIMTDGLENASREFTQESIRKLIKQKETEGWDFTYMGANHDAYAASGNIGVSIGNTVKYDTGNTINVFATLGNVHSSYMSAQSLGKSVTRSALFTAADKTLLQAGTDEDQTVLSSTK